MLQVVSVSDRRSDGVDVPEADDPKVTKGRTASSTDKATRVHGNEDPPHEDGVNGAKAPAHQCPATSRGSDPRPRG